jgi:hypothetical protein
MSRLNVKCPDLMSNVPTLIVAPKPWFLQLESCNSWSANPHGCIGHSGLHDICRANDSVGLMTDRKPVSRENGKNVSQTEVSSRIRQIAKESGNLEIDPGFRKSTRKTKDETYGDQMLVGQPPRCDATLISYARPQTMLFAEHLLSISTLWTAERHTSVPG